MAGALKLLVQTVLELAHTLGAGSSSLSGTEGPPFTLLSHELGLRQGSAGCTDLSLVIIHLGWWPAQHLLSDLRLECFTVVTTRATEWASGKHVRCGSWSFWSGKIKRDIPSPLFSFSLTFDIGYGHPRWVSPVFSSKSYDNQRRENGWHHRSHKWKMKQWQEARFLIIPFKMLLPPEFVWYEFFLISISIRTEKFATKDICSVNVKLPAFQERWKKSLWDFQEFVCQKAEISLRPAQQSESFLLSFRIHPFSPQLLPVVKFFSSHFLLL